MTRPSPRAALRHAAPLAFAVACACTGVEPGVTIDGVTRSKRGDTTIVYTARDGAWGPAHDAIVVKRIAGGTKETTFGMVFILAATPDGGVVIVDVKGAEGIVVRQFDSTGTFLRNLGRQGRGPGEYDSGGLIWLSVDPNGTILIRDGSRAVSRYSADGKLINEFALRTGSGPPEVYAATGGSMYVRGPFQRGRAIEIGYAPPLIRLDSMGAELDTMRVEHRWLGSPSAADPRYTPTDVWTALPDGRTLHLRSDQVGFLIVDPAGKSTPLIAEAKSEPVPYAKEERDELVAEVEWLRGRPNETPRVYVDVPKNKLAVYWAGPAVDIDGRIWMYKHATAQKVTPVSATASPRPPVTYVDQPVLAAFQADGTYLGEVRFPMGARVTFVRNTAWAVVPGADDAPVLVKYRIH